MMRFMRRLAKGFRRDETGTASVEFAMAVPVLIAVFMASFESGLFMTRSIMLEQSVDMTMRELRLGHYPIPTAALLKEEICGRTVIFAGCQDAITIEMTRISTTNWTMPSSAIACVDRDEDINPVTALQIGQQNDIMLVRICVVQDAIFPLTGIGLGLPKDGAGGYALYTTTAFVTEPS